MSIASIVSMGYLPGGNDLPGVVLMGYSNGAEAPAPPVVEVPSLYGPALTPAQRRRWFEGTSNVFESPEQRAARKAAIERLKRVEIGLIEPEATEEERAEAEERIEAKVDAVLPSVAVRALGQAFDQKAVVEKVVRAVAAEIRAEREAIRLEMEEEEEAMAILAMMVLR